MNPSQGTDRNERLGAALRRGDPASEEAGLSPGEMQAMRRAVLSAASEKAPRRAFRLAPAFAAGAVAMLSLAVALSLWRMHEPGLVAPAAPVSTPAVPVPTDPASQSPMAVAVAMPAPPAHAARRREPARRPRIAERPAVHETVPEAEPDTAVPMRQVQFSTAGGTRIIWLLPETSQGAFQGD